MIILSHPSSNSNEPMLQNYFILSSNSALCQGQLFLQTKTQIIVELQHCRTVLYIRKQNNNFVMCSVSMKPLHCVFVSSYNIFIWLCHCRCQCMKFVYMLKYYCLHNLWLMQSASIARYSSSLLAFSVHPDLIEQHILDTNAVKQLSQAATDV